MQITIIDLGSQYTQLISRALRALGVRSIILAPDQVNAWLKNNRPKGMILSGGYASVYESNAPQPPTGILDLGTPILGICYGMQWLVSKLNGKICAPYSQKQYGKTQVIFNIDDELSADIPNDKNGNVTWMSHGDSIDQLPKGFLTIAYSATTDRQIVGISNLDKKIWGVMFHPEVTQTEHGQTIFANFLFRICKCCKDWSGLGAIHNIREKAQLLIKGEKAILGFSGGVDSSTVGAAIGPTLGPNLLAICIDAGNLRQDELTEIKHNAQVAGVCLKIVHAQRRFLKALQGITDPQRKRRIFQKLYGQILLTQAEKFGAQWLIQGTLAPDKIESGKVGQSTVIKTHHNTGKISLKQWDPLAEFFKYEIRDLARKLGLPPGISERQPFPGPGLFVRIIDTPVTVEKLQIVRWADKQVTKTLRRHDIYHEISQLVIALTGRSVGVKGDARVYGWTITVRPVITLDFMTTTGYHIPSGIKTEIENALTQHPKIVRVAFDTTSKPPATIELE